MKQFLFLLLLGFALIFSCNTIKDGNANDGSIKQLTPEKAINIAKKIESEVKPQLAEGIELKLWASDSLIINPISISIDHQGRAFVSSTQRRNHAEFDIRRHRDWMTESMSFQTVEDRRNFTKRYFDASNSEKNNWLPDLNDDGVTDWQDLLVEDERIIRLEDKSGDGVADFAQEYASGFNTEISDVMNGVLTFDDEIFAGIAPDLWRLKDTNGDGKADKRESISHGYGVHIGFGGHGMSGLTVGPDGKIWWSIGDIGANIVDKEGKAWKYPNEGIICRANPDGSDFEVFAHGVRNTHEFVFDEYGNLITVDNDGDHPGEKERLVYLVNGSDSGWRINWQFGKYTDPDNNAYKVWMDEKLYQPRFEGQAAYILPPIKSYHNGPAGMKYNPGTALGEKWKNKFFFAEFVGNPARSKLWAFQLTPKGAGFDFDKDEVVLSGILPVGIDFGPDGALYMVDWVDGWNISNVGRVWKMDVPAAEAHPLRAETQQLLAAEFAKKDIAALSELLKHADMRVRQKAQFELAKRGNNGLAAFVKMSEQTGHQLARVHAIWGIGQLARKDKAIAEKLVPLLNDKDDEIVAQATKILGDIRYESPASQFIQLLQHPSPRVQFFAVEALGRIAHATAVQPIIDLVIQNDNEDTYLRHGAMIALGRIGQAEPLVALKNHPSRAARIVAVVALRRMQHKGVAEFLKDADEYIVTEAARAINDDLSIEAALPALAQVLQETRFTDEALWRRAINANSRVGKPENIELLKAFILRKSAPAAMRAEAIAALSVWANPSVLDRVDGRYRGVAPRDGAPATAALQPVVESLLAENNPIIQMATIVAIGKMNITTAASTLANIVQRHKDAEVRSQALITLNQIDAPQLDKMLDIALNDKSEKVRATALSIIPESKLPEQRAVELFEKVLNKGSIQEQQAVFTALSQFKGAPAVALLANKMEALMKNQLLPSLELELVETVAASEHEGLKALLQQYEASKPKEDRVAAYRECLEGGNVEKGKNIALWDGNAQCLKCHAIGGPGAEVGPNLIHIGSKYDERGLLESLVDPSAVMALGYGFATLTLQNDEVVAGIIEDENDNSITLKISKTATRTVDKLQVKERIDAASSMPSMAERLTKRQIRDLVAYLATLKNNI